MTARRSQRRAAVFDAGRDPREPDRPDTAAAVATGLLAAARDDGILLDTRAGTEFFAVSPDTVTWLGAPVTPEALRRGDPVTIRHHPQRGRTDERLAERVWARIGRVAGPIVAVEGPELLVGGPGRGPQRVVLAEAAARQIEVRFPRLTPGYLLDVIGTRHGDYLLAVAPATRQPPYRAGHAPAAPPVSGPLPDPVTGAAAWHEPGDEPADLLGLGYPALDPEPGGPPAADPGCLRLPYRSLGSSVRVSNECSGRSAVLPVTSDGALARLFCDRCTDCTTSPRGRVADLTMTAFAALGGNLEDGCFTAAIGLA